MGETVFILLVLMGIIVITAVVFGLWLIISVMRWIFRSLFSLGGTSSQRALTSAFTCSRRTCRAANPVDARYCHRCGQQIAENSRYRLKVA